MRQNHRRRRATAYLMVLGTTMLVTIIGLSAMTLVRIQKRSAKNEGDFAEARFYARSAIEMGMLWIAEDESWRSRPGGTVWADHQGIGDGEFSLEVTDPGDGDVADSETDPVVLTGTGYKNDARYVLQVTLEPVIAPLEALNTCLHAASQVQVNSGKYVQVSGAPLSTNATLSNSGTINGDVHAAVIVKLGTVTGTVTVPAPAKDLPDTTVFDTYKNLATQIPFSGGLTGRVLTPTYSPWGTTNADGVYYLNTNNTDIVIKQTRIHGTLVVECGGKTVKLEQDVLFHSYRADYPVLIVKGNLEIKLNSGQYDLRESYAGVNFNRSGAPYQGQTDSDTSDSYPSEVQGLVHVIGTLKLTNTARVAGTVICESSVTIEGSQNRVIHNPALYENPPVGYRQVVGMSIVPGSWGRTVD